MPYTIERPSPVPLPTSFVVKKGSKIFSLVFPFMPVPVSVMEMRAYSPGSPYPWNLLKFLSISVRVVSIFSRPPFGMASRAFVARFMSTWSICVMSAMTVGSAPRVLQPPYLRAGVAEGASPRP